MYTATCILYMYTGHHKHSRYEEALLFMTSIMAVEWFLNTQPTYICIYIHVPATAFSIISTHFWVASILNGILHSVSYNGIWYECIQ